MRLAPQARRLSDDIRHGGRLGVKSTRILIELIEAMAAQIDYLQQEVRNARKERDENR